MRTSGTRPPSGVNESCIAFTLPFDAWMRGPLERRVRAGLEGLAASSLGFDRRRLLDLQEGHAAGRVQWRPVWALAVLGLWLERRG